MESRQYRRSGILQTGSPEITSSRRHRPDYLLVIMPLLLVMIGLGVIYSIGPAMSAIDHVGQNYFVEKQLLAVALAAVVFFAASRVPLGIWRKWTKPLLIVAILATLVALVLPVNPDYPAHRWVRLGGLSFQSVELLKLALLVWLADLLANRSGRAQNLRKVFRPLVATLLL
ncbi:MAG: FtsW/RodA/SpoVE family cell cycle protein, partial [Candidatus Saccharimonadales bacterium]